MTNDFIIKQIRQAIDKQHQLLNVHVKNEQWSKAGLQQEFIEGMELALAVVKDTLKL